MVSNLGVQKQKTQVTKSTTRGEIAVVINVSRLYPNAALGDNTSGNLVNYNLNKEYKSTTT